MHSQLQRTVDGEVDEVGPRDIGGHAALGLHYVRHVDPEHSREETFWIVESDDTVYLLSASRRTEDVDVEEAFDEIFSSWRWEPSPGRAAV